MTHALDTNTVVDFFREQGNVCDHFFSHTPGDIAIPAIVAYELRLGVALSDGGRRRVEALETFLADLPLLPFDDACSRQAAVIRTHLQKKGTPIGPMDVLIAATAKAHGLTLVTHNTREFKRVPGLLLEDWL